VEVVIRSGNCKIDFLLHLNSEKIEGGRGFANDEGWFGNRKWRKGLVLEAIDGLMACFVD
jgi:hypothetical protein